MGGSPEGKGPRGREGVCSAWGNRGEGLNIFAYNLIRWATFRLQKVKNIGKDGKLRQNVKNPHTKCGVFFTVIFTIKLGKFENLTFFWPTD